MSVILVVEDTQDNFDLIREALGDEYEIVRAATGQDALDKAASLVPGLVLLDMALPGMSGWEVVRQIRANRELASIRVIAVTAHAMAGDREKCLECGCDDYMTKPIAIRDLKQQVAEWMALPAHATG